MADVEMTIGGMIFGGWTRVSVTRSIEQLAGNFSLSASDRWPGQKAVKGIVPGDACKVAVDGETVITGYIDAVEPSYSAERHEVRISGRDATGDLVDCSAIHKTGEWRGARLETIAADLARPFGITVSAPTGTGDPFQRFRIEEGETVFESVERACRQRAVLAVSDGRGGLVFTRAGASRASTRLVYGENILAAEGNFTSLERFSQYTVKGQHPGFDFEPSSQFAQPRGEATDPAIGRYRPSVIIAEHSLTLVSARDRALWEANVRAARARRATITVQGWRERPGGALWAPNRVVGVTDAGLDLDRDMLIASVTYTKGQDGSSTSLSLMVPGAFELRAEPEPTEAASWIR